MVILITSKQLLITGMRISEKYRVFLTQMQIPPPIPRARGLSLRIIT